MPRRRKKFSGYLNKGGGEVGGAAISRGPGMSCAKDTMGGACRGTLPEKKELSSLCGKRVGHTLDFICEQQAHALEAVLATINVIPAREQRGVLKIDIKMCAQAASVARRQYVDRQMLCS